MARAVNCNLILPAAADALHEGCPVLTKRRHFIISQGQCGTVQWQLRWPDGEIADITACTADSASPNQTSAIEDSMILKARFQGCDRTPLVETDVTIITPAEGLVQFDIPSAVCSGAGIYRFEVALLAGEDNDVVAFSDRGMISVEAGMWGNEGTGGPPSLQEIRLHLRDSAIENDLLLDVEFDDAEIINAIVHPIQQFNETPPPLTYFSCANFPYRHHWRNAIAAELLKTAAFSYTRNKLKMSSGGLSGDDKDKDNEYLRLAAMYDGEWREFINRKKAELNAVGFTGTLGTGYEE